MTNTGRMLYIRLAVAMVLSGPVIFWLFAPTAETSKSKHPCGQLSNRPLRVGITEWAGFAGGILANGGLHSNTGRASRWAYGPGVEFLLVDGFESRERALSDCTVDVLWSSVESWAGEFPRLVKRNIHARAIMEIARSRGADVLVANAKTQDISELRRRSLATPRFTPAHWLAEQAAPNIDTIALLDSPAEAIDVFLRGNADAVAGGEPDIYRALKLPGAHVIELDRQREIAYLMVVREDLLQGAHDVLRDFVQNWLYANQESNSSPDIVAKLLRENRRAQNTSLQVIEAEFKHAKLVGLAENMKFFGLDGGKPSFDEEFKNASVRWMVRGFVDPSGPQEARSDALLREIYNTKPAVPALPSLCAPNAKVTEVDRITIDFDPPGSFEILDQYRTLLDQVALTLKTRPGTQACIEGHTDSSGADTQNTVLSVDRAHAAADYLRAMGIGQDRVVTAGKGDHEPISSNSTPDGRAANRRATIRVVREGEE